MTFALRKEDTPAIQPDAYLVPPGPDGPVRRGIKGTHRQHDFMDQAKVRLDRRRHRPAHRPVIEAEAEVVRVEDLDVEKVPNARAASNDEGIGSRRRRAGKAHPQAHRPGEVRGLPGRQFRPSAHLHRLGQGECRGHWAYREDFSAKEGMHEGRARAVGSERDRLRSRPLLKFPRRAQDRPPVKLQEEQPAQERLVRGRRGRVVGSGRLQAAHRNQQAMGTGTADRHRRRIDHPGRGGIPAEAHHARGLVVDEDCIAGAKAARGHKRLGRPHPSLRQGELKFQRPGCRPDCRIGQGRGPGCRRQEEAQDQGGPEPGNQAPVHAARSRSAGRWCICPRLSNPGGDSSSKMTGAGRARPSLDSTCPT